MMHSKLPVQVPVVTREKPEISMAPLIDVIFLLLIFFMVTTVFPENRGLLIEKPKSQSSEQLKLQKLIFTVDAKGQIYFKDKVVQARDVSRIIAERLGQRPDSLVLLQVDQGTITQHLIKVFDACKQGGAQSIAIATKDYESGV